ncbi:hypothetical protein B9Z19DRAFT_1066801 [Tuber borchii]|uniref:Uncharacterized protein n=1 Tax=Tuber borchii TaxID=42251 RepID=A0A2T6ZL73_TUBBO|nr:hypothetical protein B9Z19DRAFT_1066801 [Tuber borchii]
MGSVCAMKNHGLTTCSVRFVVEKSFTTDTTLHSSRVCLLSSNRVTRLWTEYTPAKVCNNCLQLGHISTLYAFPPRCRLCQGNHSTCNHICQALNCNYATGEACEYTVHLCLLYESSGHYTGYLSCSSFWLILESDPPPLGSSSIEGDASAIVGVANRSYGREHQKINRCYWPTLDRVIILNTSVTEKDIAATKCTMDKGKERAWEVSDEEAGSYSDG